MKPGRFGGSEPRAKNLSRDAREDVQRFESSMTVNDVVASRQPDRPDLGRPADRLVSSIQMLRTYLVFSIDSLQLCL